MATEVNKLSFKEKTKIIEIVSENCKSNLPKAFTIYGDSLNEYVKLIDVAKKNKADWIILQPLIKKNTTDEDCYKFFKKLIPVANNTIVGIQNAKEYLGVGLSVNKIKKLSDLFPNFRVIKNESSSVFIKEEIKQLSRDLRMFNGRGGQEVVDNFLVGCKGIVPEDKRAPVLVFSGKDLTDVQEDLLNERVTGLVKKDDVSMDNLSKMIQGIIKD